MSPGDIEAKRQAEHEAAESDAGPDQQVVADRTDSRQFPGQLKLVVPDRGNVDKCSTGHELQKRGKNTPLSAN